MIVCYKKYWRQDLDFELTRVHLLWFFAISVFDTLGTSRRGSLSPER